LIQPEKPRPITRSKGSKNTPLPGPAKQAPVRPTEFRVLNKRAAELERQIGDVEQQLRKAREEQVKAEASAAVSERRAQELSGVTLRVGPLEQEVAALRPQLEEARRRLKEIQADLKRTREERDRYKGEVAASVERAAGLEAREKEALAQMGRMTALKLEASSFRLRLETTQSELKKTQEELRANADGAAKVQAAARAQSAAQAEALQKIEAARKAEASAKAELEGLRKKMSELSEELHRLREARDKAESDNIQQRAQAAELQEELTREGAQTADFRERLAREEGRHAETRRRADGLERDAAAAKKAEAMAREAAAMLARDVASAEERRRADVARLEALKADQDKSLAALGEKVALLERRLAEAQARKPEPAVVQATPPPIAIKVDPIPIVASPPSAPAPAPAAIPPAEPTPAPTSSSADSTLRMQNGFGPSGVDGQAVYCLHEIRSKDALGVVYVASERATGRKFLVQFMSGQAGEEQTQAMERGMEKLVALPHPNILHVQGTGRRKNRLYVMMDFVEAQTLEEAKIREVPRICAIVRDAAAAIHYAHEEGVFHGGVNPETILVAKDADKDLALVKEFCLGFLQELAIPSTPTNAAPPVFRNPAYLPPEQMRTLKSALNASVDVYGLGATLYWALSGQPPFEGKDPAQIAKRVMIQEPRPVEKHRSDVPPAVGAVVRRAMAKERGLRYATAQEMADALGHYLDSAV
jgi:hypothetical protein